MGDFRFELAHSLEDRWKRVADASRPETGGDRLLQAALTVVSPVYAAGAWAHRMAYRSGILRTETADAPVLCVGNLSLGGTGKTPVVAWLARRLQEAGHRPAILSRGYGGRAALLKTVDALIVSDGRHVQYSADMAGDEPLELATQLHGIPVVIGRKRARAAGLAEHNFNVDCLILDDGFQHYALARSCNIVVLDASNPPRELRRFPRGTLREGLSALRRAHAVILTRCDHAPAGTLRPLISRIRRRFPELALAPSVMEPKGLATVEGDLFLHPPVLQGKRALLFCGVGNPLSVVHSIEKLGMEVADTRMYPDHAAVADEELESLRARARDLAADFLVCTRKDAVKISRDARVHPQWPVLVVAIEPAFHPSIAETRLLDHVLKLAFPPPPEDIPEIE